MIFRSKKKAKPEKVETEPAAAEPRPEAPKVAERMQRIEAPQPAPTPARVERNDPVDSRARLHETVGKIALAAMSESRYRHHAIGEMQALFLEPMLHNRIAIASPSDESGKPTADAPSAIAIWASVSAEIDAKIREQIEAGSFPVRLQPGDWASGEINWLLDIISPSQQLTTAVLANFRQVLKEGEICIHPLLTRRPDPDVLEKLGAKQMAAPASA